jgi:NAD+ kinase
VSDATRRVLLVTHTGRATAVSIARTLVDRLHEADILVRTTAFDAVDLGDVDLDVVASDDTAARDCELVVVLGGDGTILRGAELARSGDVPLLGVNVGRMGFLAEAEQQEVVEVADHVVERRYDVEDRLALDVVVSVDDRVVYQTWALNEVSVEKADRPRMLDVVVDIDAQPLSRWGADGVLCATPTGSTAYAFSAGGPVVWPDVEALLVMPLSAHALFSRALVVSPGARVRIHLLPDGSRGVLWADSRRTFDIAAGTSIEITRSAQPVRFARLHHAAFTKRLVAKFALPVEGWRGVTPT